MSCATHCWFNSPQDFFYNHILLQQLRHHFVFLPQLLLQLLNPQLLLVLMLLASIRRLERGCAVLEEFFHPPMKHRRLQILLVADVRNGLLLDQMFSQNRNFFLRRVIVSFFLQGTSVVSILTAVYSISD